MDDHIQRFLLINYNIRGAIVRLKRSFQEAVANQNNHPIINKLIGEFMAANTLLGSILKYKGAISMEIKGSGNLQLLLSQMWTTRGIRSMAKMKNEIIADDFKIKDPGNLFNELIPQGNLIISIEPEGQKRYQGMVAVNPKGTAETVADYFEQSEQTRTWIFLSSDREKSAGILLQLLPENEQNADFLTPDDKWIEFIHNLQQRPSLSEIFSQNFEDTLNKLMHGEKIHFFEASSIFFQCSCSRKKISSLLKTLGEEESRATLREYGEIQVRCEFCKKPYHYSQSDIDKIFRK